MIKLNAMAKEPCRGVFWVIDGKVVAFPFNDEETDGVAKSGLTYNHKKLWKALNVTGKRVPYNYYPRGRVDFNNRGKPIVYINPNIDDYDLKEVKLQFGLREDPIVKIDNSQHYKCYLDDGWKPAK